MDFSLLTVTGIFILGLAVGSFLNVCIWRLPSGEQVVQGRSACRTCHNEIPWYDNIPVVSYFLLGAKCRFCSAKISWSYPFVELATAVLFLMLIGRFGVSSLMAVYAFLGALLIMLSMIDWREMILPDAITLPGLSTFAVLSFYLPELHGMSSNWGSLGQAALGAFVGAGVLWGIAMIGELIFKREAMGQGDMKLMAMVGAVIGWQQVLLVNLILAPILGSVVGVVLKFKYKRELIPYGPFLALGTIISIFWGQQLLAWYQSLITV